MPLLQRDSPITFVLFILPLFCLAAYAAYQQYLDMATKPSNHNLNVFKKPLGLFSHTPPTGFYRDGYCRTGPDDIGNHAVAGILTKEFLDFSASRGNNLRAAGLEPGCKWCLCTARWKEALDAFSRGEIKDANVVPKVFLHATDESALKNGVTVEVLKKYAAEQEAQMGGADGERSVPVDPSKPGSIAKETH